MGQFAQDGVDATQATSSYISRDFHSVPLVSKGDHRGWLEAGVQSLAPDHPDLLISVARARAALGQVKESLDSLRQAVDRGSGIDVARVPEFQKLPPSPELEALIARSRKNLAPVARAPLFAVIPDATANSEGIAYDPVSRRLFVGTVHGEILQVDERGSITPFVPRGVQRSSPASQARPPESRGRDSPGRRSAPNVPAFACDKMPYPECKPCVSPSTRRKQTPGASVGCRIFALA
jgi:hypothetical protein